MLAYFIVSGQVFSNQFSPLSDLTFSMSPRRSPRKKNISPETVDSDNEGFEAVGSDISYVV